MIFSDPIVKLLPFTTVFEYKLIENSRQSEWNEKRCARAHAWEWETKSHFTLSRACVEPWRWQWIETQAIQCDLVPNICRHYSYKQIYDIQNFKAYIFEAIWWSMILACSLCSLIAVLNEKKKRYQIKILTQTRQQKGGK